MSNTSKPHIELYVRSLVPDGAHTRQEAVIERLEALEREDQIEDFSVIVWGKQVSRESAAAHTEEGKYILNRVAEFKQWALSNNVSPGSFYQTTEIQSEFTDDCSAMVLPVMGLAEYSEGELTGGTMHDAYSVSATRWTNSSGSESTSPTWTFQRFAYSPAASSRSS